MYRFGYIRIFVQEVVHFLFDKVAYIFIDCHSAGNHIGRTQLRFRLTLKDRLFHIDGNGSNQSVTNVGIVHILVEIFLDGTGHMLFESTLMRTSLRGVLSVDKRVILLTILAGMRKSELDIFSFQVDDGI